MMKAEEIAWVAGIIEGEGSIGLYRHSSRKSACRVVVAVAMTDLDVLEKLKTLSCQGTIQPKSLSGLGKKQQWVWAVQNQAGVKEILTKVYPWLSVRRKAQTEKVLDYIKGRQK